MAKLTLTDLANLTNEQSAITAINANNAITESALENTLSRDGTAPNEMNDTLDMNSNSIVNLPARTLSGEPLRLQDLEDFVGGVLAITPPTVASQAEAEAGLQNSKMMTPLRVSQAGASYIIPTRAVAVTKVIPANILSIRTTGYTTIGDKGAALYKRVNAQPSHLGKFRSTDRFLATGATDNTNGGWWELMEDNVNVAMFGAVGDGIADDTTAIQGAINYVQGRTYPGGTVFIPANFHCAIVDTILVTKPNVRIHGEGSNQSHDGGSSSSDGTSTLDWYGAAGGTMVKFATPYSATSSVVSDVGFERIKLNGIDTAGVGVRVDSIRRGTFKELYVISVTEDAYLITCGVTGTDAAEAADTQNCIFDRCTFRMVDSAAVQSANGFRLAGSNNANTSFNTFIQCGGQHWDGAGFLFENCDNNLLLSCSAFRNGGTGYTYDFWGAQASPVTIGGVDNTIIHPSWANSNGCILRGTDDVRFSAAATDNVFHEIDSGNGALLPTAGTGATHSASRMSGEFYRSGPIGYSTGTGGTVTQGTSKTTDVTLNKITGQIVTHDAALNAGVTVDFKVNNTDCASTDTVSVNLSDAAGTFTAESYQAWAMITSTNSFRVALKNITGGNLSEAVCVQFNIHKGAIS